MVSRNDQYSVLWSWTRRVQENNDRLVQHGARGVCVISWQTWAYHGGWWVPIFQKEGSPGTTAARAMGVWRHRPSNTWLLLVYTENCVQNISIWLFAFILECITYDVESEELLIHYSSTGFIATQPWRTSSQRNAMRHRSPLQGCPTWNRYIYRIFEISHESLIIIRVH